MQAPTATTRNSTIQNALRRRMSELARRSQRLHLDPQSVQQIRLALYG